MDINQIFDFFFNQYSDYTRTQIILEIIGVFFGIFSVLLQKKNNVLVFPVGIISTFIFTYLLYEWGLIGDMLINFYYFIMSIYGWYIWSTKSTQTKPLKISRTSKQEKITSLFIFGGILLLVSVAYVMFDKFKTWSSYVDTLTTSIFFVAMWLLARRKLETWTLWIIGDLISIPLYFYKGYTFTSFQYLAFTIIAIFGYNEWKKLMIKEQAS